MSRLLVVHHTPSPALQAMFEAAVSGSRTDEIDGVEVVVRPALTAAPTDVLQADAYLLGTPAKLSCRTPVPLAPLAWWIRLPRSVVATGVARIHLERIIHRGNFRMAEWAARL